jgi:hypothetical protein
MAPAFSFKLAAEHDSKGRVAFRNHAPTIRRRIMPRKPGLNSEFVMFDVLYEDGTQRSNRKVPRELLGGIDGDKPAHGFLIEQDREIAEKSGRPLAKIKSITRSGAKKKARDAEWKKAC